MNFFLKLVFPLFFLLFLYGCATNKIPSSKACDQLESVRTNILLYHPYPYYNTGKKVTDSIFDVKREQLSSVKRVSKSDLLNDILEYTSSFNDGHLRIVPSMGNEMVNMLTARYFPFDIMIKENMILVDYNYSECSDIKTGCRIIAIDGVKAQDFLTDLRNKIPSENQALKNQELSAYFPYKYWTLGNNRKKYTITLITLNNDTIVRNIQSISSRKYNRNSFARKSLEFYHYFSEGNGTFYFETKADRLNERLPKSFFYLTDSIAYYRMFRFSGTKDQECLADKILALSIERKVPYLIIDLTNNPGGRTTNFSTILKYFNKDTVFQVKRVIVRLNKQIYQDALESMKRGDSLIYKRIASKQISDTVSLFSKYDFVLVKSQDNLFTGKLIVIVNEGTYSAANAFAVIVRNNHLGLIAGNESGGFTNSFGDPVTVKLPKLGYVLSIPTKLIVQDDFDKHVPLKPDVKIDVNADLNENIDKKIKSIITQISTHRNN